MNHPLDPARHTVLAAVQMACGPDPSENLDRALGGIRNAAAIGGQLICLPELFRTQYFCQAQDPANFDLAEPVPGPTTDALSAAAREHGAVIVATVFERRAPGIFHNTAVVLDADGTLLGTYRKMHIPDDPLYCEKFYFTPGDLGYRVFATRFGRVAPLICWDQWFPEAARLASLAGADFLVYPTAIGWHPCEKGAAGDRQVRAWEVVLRANGIANGTFVAAVNRVGHERVLDSSEHRPANYEGLEFWGQSFVSDPMGDVVACAEDGEETFAAICDRAQIERTRRDWPFLRDRRTDSYGKIAERYID